MQNPFTVLIVVLTAYVAIFFVAFALKLVYIEMRFRRKAPGGFEVKLTGMTPVPEKKENDHG